LYFRGEFIDRKDILYKNEKYSIAYHEKIDTLGFFKFKIKDSSIDISEDIFFLVNQLNTKEIPYNIIFLQNEIIVIPRKNQIINREISLGFCEWLGIIVHYNKKDFDSFTKDVFYENIKMAKIDDETIKEIKEIIYIKYL
jgi:hypothetical protein